MSDADSKPRADRRRAPGDAPAGRTIDRRTLLAGASGGLVAMMLGWPSLAGARSPSSESLADAGFSPALATRLQQMLDDVVAHSRGTIPGAILHVERTRRGRWTGAAGLGQVDPDVAMRPADRFRAGSIVKPFVAVTVLQLVERGRFTLDAALPEVLPAEVTDRFPGASEITVRMLLGHRSGIADWSTPVTDAAAAREPDRIWKVSDVLDLAAAKKPAFSPGARYGYSNTNYTLLGLVIEQAANRGWREEVSDRVIRPLGLSTTALPAPGNSSWAVPYAHGYLDVNGKVFDTSMVDPSMAGSAGGHALVTSAPDLVRFYEALLAGRLFRRLETLKQMLTLAPAPDVGGQVAYGLGIERRVLPGGVELIGNLGGAGGYFAYAGTLPDRGVTFAVAMNSSADPSPLILPVVGALAGAPR
jgi:D-alanyl-D-alanine carboxypeptidase